MSKSRNSKVSICIPVYNGSDYIAESIHSVLSQTFEDFDLIVCDNCSTDNTGEIVRSFHDPRLRYVRNAENLGLVGNANHCLELSKGEYICIFHHDDVMLPDNLQSKVQLLDEHPDVGFVHSNLIMIDEKGKLLAPQIWNADSRLDYMENGVSLLKKYLSYLPFGASVFIGAVLARRTCYEKVGVFNPVFPHCNDSEMWIRMMLNYKVACIGTPLVKYRVHSVSTSSNWGDYKSLPYLKEHYQLATMVFNKYKDRIPQADILKRKIFFSFGERAMKFANDAIGKGDVFEGKLFFKEAVTFAPDIIKNIIFWKTVLKIAIGSKGVRLIKRLKKHLNPDVH